MLGEVFYWLLNMSIIGSLAGFFVLLIRSIRRIPRFIPYLLWTVPLVRLWIPFVVTSKYSLMNLLSKYAVKTVVVYEKAPFPDFSSVNCLLGAQEYFPIVYKTNSLEKLFETAALVWIIIAISLFLTAAALYFLTKAELRGARRLRDNIYVSDKILAPAVFGIIRAKIILPEYLGGDESEYVLMHEKAHIKRCDNLLRIIAVCTVCLHWFNPAVWLFLKCFFTDMELSCDEKVLKLCGEDKKKKYATVLLSCEKQKALFSSAFGGAKTRARIENILSYKRMTVFSGICLGLLVALIAITLLTNA